MPDFDAVAVAVVGRYAAAQVTPPAGYTNIRKATADPPQQLGPLPAVVLFVDRGATTALGNQTRELTHEWIVRFYYSSSRDIARDMAALRKWLTVLLDQHRTSMQLGGLVTAVRTLTYRLAILPYGQKSYAGIELGIQVVTTEGWSPTA